MDLSPLQAYVTAITPILKLLILSTVWSAALIPLLILLFFLSTATVRKQPIFILNVFSVSMGVIIGIANVKLFAGQILTPTDFIPIRTLLAYMGMILAMPILMDCILAYRLSAVYPRRTTSRRLLAVIFIPIILFKVARTVNLTIFMVMFSKDNLKRDAQSILADCQRLWDHGRFTRVESIFQVVDNCYTSSFFLWQLWQGQSYERTSGRVGSFDTLQNSDTSKIQRLFYLALSSFLFPCIFSIIEVILVFHNHDFFLGGYIFVTNLYFEIICVLLATIWAVKTRIEEDALRDQMCTNYVSSMSFRPGESATEVHITRDVEVITTLAGIELNDLSKESRRRPLE